MAYVRVIAADNDVPAGAAVDDFQAWQQCIEYPRRAFVSLTIVVSVLSGFVSQFSLEFTTTPGRR